MFIFIPLVMLLGVVVVVCVTPDYCANEFCFLDPLRKVIWSNRFDWFLKLVKFHWCLNTSIYSNWVLGGEIHDTILLDLLLCCSQRVCV